MVSGHKKSKKCIKINPYPHWKTTGLLGGVAGQRPLSNSSKGLLKLFTKRAFLFVPLPKARRVNETWGVMNGTWLMWAVVSVFSTQAFGESLLLRPRHITVDLPYAHNFSLYIHILIKITNYCQNRHHHHHHHHHGNQIGLPAYSHQIWA